MNWNLYLWGCFKMNDDLRFRPPYVPGYNLEQQLNYINDKLDCYMQTYEQVMANCYKTLHDLETTAELNGSYFANCEVNKQEGYNTEQSDIYKIIQIDPCDKNGRPIKMKLNFAYNNTTNSKIEQSIFGASKAVSADKMFIAQPMMENGWYGHVIQQGQLMPSDQTQTTLYTFGFTKHGTMKVYSNAIDVQQLFNDGIENSMGCCAQIIINGALSGEYSTAPNYNTQTSRICVGQNYQNKKTYILICDVRNDENHKGLTTEECANILLGYGCNVAVEVNEGNSVFALDKGYPMVDCTENTNGYCFWYITKAPEFTNTLQAEIATLYQQQGQCAYDYCLSKKKITGIETDIDSLQDSINTINTSIDNINNNIEQLQTNIDNINTDIDAINGNITNIKSDISEINSTIDGINSNLSGITERVETCENNISTLQTNYTALQQLVNNINTTVNNHTGNIVTLQGQVGNLQTSLTAVQSQLTSLDNTVATITQTIATIEETLNEIKTSITNVQSRVATLEADNTTNKANITQLQSDVSSINDNVSNLDNRLTSAGLRLDKLEADNTTNKQNITNLQSETSSLNTRVTALEDGGGSGGDIPQIKADIEQLQSDVTELQNNINNLDTRLKSLGVRIDTVEKDNRDNKNNISELQQQIQQFENNNYIPATYNNTPFNTNQVLQSQVASMLLDFNYANGIEFRGNSTGLNKGDGILITNDNIILNYNNNTRQKKISGLNAMNNNDQSVPNAGFVNVGSGVGVAIKDNPTSNNDDTPFHFSGNTSNGTYWIAYLGNKIIGHGNSTGTTALTMRTVGSSPYLLAWSEIHTKYYNLKEQGFVWNQKSANGMGSAGITIGQNGFTFNGNGDWSFELELALA